MADDAKLTPQQAAQALADLARHEEALSARVGGLTAMVWGIVSAAIFVTYGFAPDIRPRWAIPFLWLPWTAAGVALTIGLWRLHAISMRRTEGSARTAIAWTFGFTGLFLAAVLGLHLLRVGHGAFPYMLVVNGLVAFVIVALVSRREGRLAAVPMIAAGVLLVAGAFVLGALGLSTMALAFASAALVGACYVGAGLVAFVRG